MIVRGNITLSQCVWNCLHCLCVSDMEQEHVKKLRRKRLMTDRNTALKFWALWFARAVYYIHSLCSVFCFHQTRTWNFFVWFSTTWVHNKTQALHHIEIARLLWSLPCVFVYAFFFMCIPGHRTRPGVPQASELHMQHRCFAYLYYWDIGKIAIGFQHFVKIWQHIGIQSALDYCLHCTV